MLQFTEQFYAHEDSIALQYRYRYYQAGGEDIVTLSDRKQKFYQQL